MSQPGGMCCKCNHALVDKQRPMEVYARCKARVAAEEAR